MTQLTRGIVEERLHEIIGHIEHGECFYNADIMDELLEDIDGLRSACIVHRVEIALESGNE